MAVETGLAAPAVVIEKPAPATAPAYGTVALNANGSYTFTLDNTNAVVQGLAAGETLQQQYDYTMRDADGDTSTATLTITIFGADDGVTITGLRPGARWRRDLERERPAGGSSPERWR